MYSYFYIKTDCRTNTWDTIEILDYLQSFTILDEKDNGIFVSKNPFLDISLMKVKDLNCWSSLDFDKEETNYPMWKYINLEFVGERNENWYYRIWTFR